MTAPRDDFGDEARDDAHPPAPAGQASEQPLYPPHPGEYPWQQHSPPPVGPPAPVNYPENLPSYPPPPPRYPPPGYPPPSYQPPGYPPPYSAGPPGYQGYPGYPDPYDPYLATSRPGTNSLAIGSLVSSLGGFPLLFFCYIGVIAWVAGIVLGIVALNQIKQTNQDGRALAIAGIAVGAVALVLAAVGALVFVAMLRHTPY